MDVRGRTLGVLIAMPPDSLSHGYALDLIRAALDRGVRVHLYLLDDAVKAAAQETILALAGRGVRVSGCALAARRRGIPLDEPVLWGGLGLLSDIIVRTDRFVGFCC